MTERGWRRVGPFLLQDYVDATGEGRIAFQIETQKGTRCDMDDLYGAAIELGVAACPHLFTAQENNRMDRDGEGERRGWVRLHASSHRKHGDAKADLNTNFELARLILDCGDDEAAERRVGFRSDDYRRASLVKEYGPRAKMGSTRRRFIEFCAKRGADEEAMRNAFAVADAMCDPESDAVTILDAPR